MRRASNNIGILASAAFFVISLAPLFLFVDFYSVSEGRFRSETLAMRGAAIALVAAATLILIARSGPLFLRRIRTKTYAPIFLFAIYIITTSLISVDPLNSILYAITFIILIIFYIQQSSTDDLTLYNIGRMAAVLFIIIMILLIFFLGLDGRRVGGIQANNFGKIAFGSFCVAFLWSGRAGFILKFLSLIFILLVNSRSALLGAIVFSAIMFLTDRWRRLGVAMASFTVALVFFIAIAFPSATDFLLLDVLAIADPARGLGSGFSGRTQYWELGLSVLSERPLFGYGFQTRTSTETADLWRISAHQGFINMMLDVGVLGFVIFISTVIVSIFGELHIIAQKSSPQTDEESFLVSRFSIAFIGSFLFIWLLEPIYINFGQPPSIILIFCLAHGAESLRAKGMRRSNIRSAQRMSLTRARDN